MSRPALSLRVLAPCLLWVCPALAAGLPTGVQRIDVDAPRPYGYVIGDLIEMTVDIDVLPGVNLDRTALPKAGAVNRWLNLRQVRVDDAGHGYRVRLQYQTFYAPLEVKNLAVPGFDLHFTGATGEVQARVPEWPFTMAPIRELSVLRAGGLEPMRGDAWPQAPDGGPARLVFAAGALAALLAVSGFVYLRGWFGFGARGRPFAAALKVLREFPDETQDAERLQQAYSSVHEAFNHTLGETLFLQGLGDFFARRPDYEVLRDEVEAFFASSYRLFFGDIRDGGFSVVRLRSLCRACLRLERLRR